MFNLKLKLVLKNFFKVFTLVLLVKLFIIGILFKRCVMAFFFDNIHQLGFGTQNLSF